MPVMGLQNRAIALQIDTLSIVSGKDPVSAGLLQAAFHGSLLVTCAGWGGTLVALIGGRWTAGRWTAGRWTAGRWTCWLLLVRC